MRIAVTGATGFLGRYIVNRLTETGSLCRCWFREGSDRGGFDQQSEIEWVPGDLSHPSSMTELVRSCDAVVHAALYRPGLGFRGHEGDLPTFVERNVLSTIRLIEAARSGGAGRFIFISTCAVHELILPDRKLDEAHPLWPTSHYGAHKGAIEKFVHSYGLGQGYDICALRPTGIYGVARPATESRWFDLVQRVRRGERIATERGGKEVHAADVAEAVRLLLTAPGIAGQAYNCYDRYVAEQEVAEIAKRLCGSGSEIVPMNKGPKNQIDTARLRALGMAFGGQARVEEVVGQLLDAASD